MQYALIMDSLIIIIGEFVTNGKNYTTFTEIKREWMYHVIYTPLLSVGCKKVKEVGVTRNKKEERGSRELDI